MNQPTDQMTEEHSLRLDDQLCFALYAASRAVTARYRPLLDQLGLTYPQYLVMLVLWEHGEVHVKDLRSALHLETSTLSPLLKRMESDGLISRRRCGDDERSVIITPTAAGTDLHDKARTVPPAMAQAMGLSPDELTAAKELLRQLTTNLTHS